MADNLIVSDEYMKEIAKYIQKQGLLYNEMLSVYRSIISNLCENGIKEGNIHDALMALIEASSCIEGEMKEMSLYIYQKLGSFVGEINEADRYL